MPIPLAILCAAAALVAGCWIGASAGGRWRTPLARARRRMARVLGRLFRAGGPSERSLADDLPGAIDRGEMFLVHQPKLHARSGAVPAVETLVRWQHPARGLIGPNDFIALAEDQGEIRRLTEWVIRQAVAEQRGLAGCGHRLAFNINISARILADRDFAEWALAAVKGAAGPIGFEITETAMIADPEGALRNLHLFADAEVRIAIDDYGAGLSSLAYLKQLPATELKIDRMFVSGLSSSHRDPLLVRSTIDLAHALDMEVTAEGVDSPAALALLRVMGCDLIQGFLVSRPLTVGDLRGFLDGRVMQASEPIAPGFSWFRKAEGG